jgi:hypothetical protein
MRNLTSLIAPRKGSAKQMAESPRRGTQKSSASAAESKPVRKRCLNEAAHKLSR